MIKSPKWCVMHHENRWWVCLKKLGGGMSSGRTIDEAKLNYSKEYKALIKRFKSEKHRLADRWWMGNFEDEHDEFGM